MFCDSWQLIEMNCSPYWKVFKLTRFVIYSNDDCECEIAHELHHNKQHMGGLLWAPPKPALNLNRPVQCAHYRALNTRDIIIPLINVLSHHS